MPTVRRLNQDRQTDRREYSPSQCTLRCPQQELGQIYWQLQLSRHSVQDRRQIEGDTRSECRGDTHSGMRSVEGTHTQV